MRKGCISPCCQPAGYLRGAASGRSAGGPTSEGPARPSSGGPARGGPDSQLGTALGVGADAAWASTLGRCGQQRLEVGPCVAWGWVPQSQRGGSWPSVVYRSTVVAPWPQHHRASKLPAGAGGAAAFGRRGASSRLAESPKQTSERAWLEPRVVQEEHRSHSVSTDKKRDARREKKGSRKQTSYIDEVQARPSEMMFDLTKSD